MPDERRPRPVGVTRIIAGSARGRRIATPTGDGTRPTADRVREALFSTIEHQRGSLAGAHVLDLYAGSGAVGLEALSRGAASALLVERDRGVCKVVRDNIATLALRGAALMPARVDKLVRSAPPEGRRFDIAFLDPPYSLDNKAVDEVLANLSNNGWLAPGALLIVERSSRTPDLGWPDGIEQVHSRRYGETRVWYGRVTQRD